MAPTRELVVQVAEEAARLTPDPEKCRCAAIIGAHKIQQKSAARRRK